MFKNKARLLFLVLLALMTSACGGGSSGSNSTNPVSPLSTTPTILEGTWLKSCGVVDAADPSSFYDIVTATFSGNSFSSSIQNFTDANCTVPFALAPNPTASGVFSLSGVAVTTTSGVQAFEFDSSITQSNGAPFDNDDFDIFYLNGNTLYFGIIDGVLDASTPSLRPDTLDFNRGFVRQ